MLTPDRGCISLSAFLYLAMVCFVSPKEPSEGPQQQQSPRQQRDLTAAAGRGGRRLFVRGRGGTAVAVAAAAGAATAGVGACTAGGGNRDDLDCAVTDGYDSPVAIFSPPSTSTPGDPRTVRPATVSESGGGSGSPLGAGVVGAQAGENDMKIPASVKLCLFLLSAWHSRVMVSTSSIASRKTYTR